MSDRITSKDGKYEGALQETDGNFVAHQTPAPPPEAFANAYFVAHQTPADGWPIAALGADVLDPVKSEPEPEPTTLPLPPDPNQRKFFIVVAILIFGLPVLGFLVGTFVF